MKIDGKQVLTNMKGQPIYDSESREPMTFATAIATMLDQPLPKRESIKEKTDRSVFAMNLYQKRNEVLSITLDEVGVIREVIDACQFPPIVRNLNTMLEAAANAD